MIKLQWTSLFFLFRTMRNPIFFTIATLLLSHVTWAGYWEDWGVTCDPEVESISVCGKATPVTKCRGTCRSLSSITMNFPYYKTKCQCCKASGWKLQVVRCSNGSKEKVHHADGCSCQDCLGAWCRRRPHLRAVNWTKHEWKKTFSKRKRKLEDINILTSDANWSF